ncbi:relaxase TraI domain protein [Escherichia coli 2741950]|nr:relaxase TraI domain protein [Escherichia coli 2741950]
MDHYCTVRDTERFVSNPPGWRDWLLRGLSTTATPGTEGSVVPEDSVQRKVWETALRQGWQEGRQNADLTLEANQKTLTRDYRKTPRNTPFVLPEPEPFENNIIIDAIFTCNLCNTSSRL